MEGTSGAADQRNFRERRWKAALTARRIFGSGGSGVTIRSQHDLRVARHPKWGERGRTTSKPKRELRFHRGASLGSSARSCFAALIQTARHVGTRHGVLRSRQVGENPRRRADADAGVARPLVGSATPELQSLVGGGPKGLPISLRAAVRRRARTERFGRSWLCSRFLTTAEVDGQHVAPDLRRIAGSVTGPGAQSLARERVLETGPRRLSHGTSGGPSNNSQRQQRSWSGGTHRRKALRAWKAAALVCRLWKGPSVPVGALGVTSGPSRTVRQEVSVARPDGLCKAAEKVAHRSESRSTSDSRRPSRAVW